MPSLRKAINGNCKDCIYDHLAPGNWRVQVSLCSCKSCPLWGVRPRTTSAIPESVIAQYGVKPEEYGDYFVGAKTGSGGLSRSFRLIAISANSARIRNKSAEES
jgi:hypothetical protein